MPNFSVGTQIKRELEDFKKPIRLRRYQKSDSESVRFASARRNSYSYNQPQLLSLIDCYYNSEFESGPYDNQNQRKMFINVGKFRADVASKQIQLGTKNAKFIPDDYADPFTAFFMQKDFKEWAKEQKFADVINVWEDNFPVYGTIVGKKVGKAIVDLPLQNIAAMQQDAESIQTATHFIEGHPGMRSWEIQAMNWNTDGFTLRYDGEYDVWERSGFVPKAWLLRQNGVDDPQVLKDAGEQYVDARVIGAYPMNDMKKDRTFHVFFAEQVTDRGYRERHWKRAHGRWMGIGVIEDLVENQRAKNVIVNLVRKSLQWSSKRISQSANADMAAKNLVMDVPDGAIMEVGPNGEIKPVILEAKTNADFQAFLAEFERNADQKAFTYEVATGENTNMTATLGVLLSKAVNSYYSKKRESFGLMLKECIMDFEVPRFIKDMDNTERVIYLFNDDAGFTVLKEAAIAWVRSEAGRVSLYTGKPIDATTIATAVDPWQAASMLFTKKKKGAWKNAKCKFDLDFTGESIDIDAKLRVLTMLYQSMVAKGDPRAEAVLMRMAALGGENMSSFGVPGAPKPPPTISPVSTGNPQVQTNQGGSALSQARATVA